MPRALDLVLGGPCKWILASMGITDTALRKAARVVNVVDGTSWFVYSKDAHCVVGRGKYGGVTIDRLKQASTSALYLDGATGKATFLFADFFGPAKHTADIQATKALDQLYTPVHQLLHAAGFDDGLFRKNPLGAVLSSGAQVPSRGSYFTTLWLAGNCMKLEKVNP